MGFRLAPERVEQAAASIDPVFLRTPQYECEPLSEQLGVHVVLKLETFNPIRSFKGRGADWLVSQLPRGSRIVCASAGNFGQAIAYAGRKYGIDTLIYAAGNANPLKLERMRRLGATVKLHGADFDAAKLEARRFAREHMARFVEDARDIETVEGAGTIGLEWLAFPEPLDTLLIPLGNGALLTGVARVVKAARPRAHVVAVQAAGAPAMVESWRAGRIVSYEHINTIADGIGVRVPIAEALEDMRGLVDDALLVEEQSMIRGMQLLHRDAGVVAEPSGAAGIAALLEQPERFRGRLVGTIVTGGNLTPEQIKTWL
jgi:threonine dehydratase